MRTMKTEQGKRRPERAIPLDPPYSRKDCYDAPISENDTAENRELFLNHRYKEMRKEWKVIF